MTRQVYLGSSLEGTYSFQVVGKSETKVDALKQHVLAARNAVKELYKEEPLLKDVEIVPGESAQQDEATTDTLALEETVANAFEAAIENPPTESEPSENKP